MMIPEAIKGFLVLLLIFVPLERLFSHRQQSLWRRGWETDLMYFFTGNLIGKTSGLIIFLLVNNLLVQSNFPREITGFFGQQSLVLQLISGIFLGEIGYYTAHRMLHQIPWLWRFHAIHHGAKELDWLVTVRVHPFDQVFTKIFQVFPLYLLGFSEGFFIVYTLFSATMAFFIHSNLGLNFRFLNYILVTPELHRWHHSQNPETYHTNFAAQLACVDWFLGTWYLSKHRSPDVYGVNESVPIAYLKQLIYPWQNHQTLSQRRGNL